MKLTIIEAMLVTFLLCSVLLLVGIFSGLISTSDASSNPSPINGLNEYKVESLINTYRYEHAVPILVRDSQLCEWADVRLEEIKTDWSHDGFNKIMQIRESKGYLGVGENLSMDTYPEELLINTWLGSPSHKENVDNPIFTSTCVRCSDNFCVQLFGAK